MIKELKAEIFDILVQQEQLALAMRDLENKKAEKLKALEQAILARNEVVAG